MVTKKEKENYDKKLYPFLGIDFQDNPEFVHTEPKEKHDYASPKECGPCKQMESKIEDLEQVIDELLLYNFLRL